MSTIRPGARGSVVMLLAAVALVTTGCTSANAPEHLDPQVRRELKDKGFSPDEVECPRLPKKMGSTITCTFTEGVNKRTAEVQNLGGSRQSDLLLKITVQGGGH